MMNEENIARGTGVEEMSRVADSAVEWAVTNGMRYGDGENIPDHNR
jgi:hypothetical protein